jgi:hypothetical protein
MISLSTQNYPIIEDAHEDDHIDRSDFDLKLTFADHELIRDLLCQSIEMMNFACDYYFDKSIDDPFIQRYTLIENLRERVNEAWSDRFNSI